MILSYLTGVFTLPTFFLENNFDSIRNVAIVPQVAGGVNRNFAGCTEINFQKAASLSLRDTPSTFAALRHAKVTRGDSSLTREPGAPIEWLLRPVLCAEKQYEGKWWMYYGGSECYTCLATARTRD